MSTNTSLWANILGTKYFKAYNNQLSKDILALNLKMKMY